MFHTFIIPVKLIKKVLPILLLFSLASCSSPNRCESMRTYLDKLECQKREENSQVALFTNLIGTGFMGIFLYLLVIKNPGVLRFTHSYVQTLDKLVTEKSPESEPVCAALNELLQLTGGYCEGIKPIFQEVRPQDKHRIKKLCEFLLKEENLLEQVEVLDELVASLEKDKVGTSDISKLREVAQQKRVLSQAVSGLLKRATD
jgi:hypothetical protein